MTKPRSSRATAEADAAQSAEPSVDAVTRESPSGHPKETPVAPDDDTVALPVGALTNAVVAETISVAASVVRLGAGLYAMNVGSRREVTPEPGSPPSPVWVGALAAGGAFEALSVLECGEQWLSESETNLAVRVTKDGALMLAAAFSSGDRTPLTPRVTVQLLDEAVSRADPDGARSQAASPQIAEPAPQGEREIRAEITAHIERVGDRVFTGSTWAGTPGAQRRIEGFSIKPLQEIQPSEIEYKALHPGGIETPWVRGPQFCGTRGRSLPLVGLAIRVAPHVQDQFSVIYQAAFLRSGITEARSNGAPCLPKLPGDTLEGINIRIVQRRPG